MTIITAVPAFKDNYIWFIKNASSQDVAIVDPGDAKPVLKALTAQQLTPIAILITHHHADHSGGIAELLQHFSLPVYASAIEPINDVTNPLADGDIVKLSKLQLNLQVLSIPGHTLGHIAFYSPSIVFSGDTLFTGGCGRIFEGTAEQMYHSLCRLAALPDDTQVYCGHEYTEANLRFAQAVEPHNSYLLQRIAVVQKLRAANLPSVPASMAEEKRTNPFLRCEVAEVIAAAEQYANQKLTTPVEVFACLREWKNNF